MQLQFVQPSVNVDYINYTPKAIDSGEFTVFMSTPEMIFLFGLTTLFLLSVIAATLLAFLVGKLYYKGQ